MEASNEVTTNGTYSHHVNAEDRGVGPEKLTVRIFREIFAKAALKNGTLKETLDDYLKTVLADKSAKRGDKTYARKIYTDLVRLVGGSGLPEWARSKALDTLSDGDINEMLTGISPEPAKGPEILACSNTPLPMPTLAPDYIDPNEILLDDPTDIFLGSTEKEDPDPFTADSSPLKAILADYVAKTVHPFIRVFELAGVRYVAVGTFVGNILKGPDTGKKINVNFTVNPYRTRRDIPEDILIHRGGRAVSVMNEDERGCRRFLFVIAHKPGLKIRFWTRVGDTDRPNAGRYVILTEKMDPLPGWREVTRSEF